MVSAHLAKGLAWGYSYFVLGDELQSKIARVHAGGGNVHQQIEGAAGGVMVQVVGFEYL